jgi:hypothetical protein
MKKLVAVLLFAISTGAFANGYHHGHGYYRNNWVAPALIGGVIGYGLARPYYYSPPPPPVVYTAPPPPVYYTQPYPAPQQVCTRYVYQDQYGNVQREETRCN